MEPDNQQPNNPYYPPRDPNQYNPSLGQQPPVQPGATGQSPYMAGQVPIVPTEPITVDELHQRPLVLIIAVSVLGFLLVGTLGLSYWLNSQRLDYKNNVNKHVSTAVAKAEKDTTDKNNKKFAEELKNPLKNFEGPSAFGSISIDYPKTWSAYINDSGSGSSEFDAYFHPDVVPNVTAKSKEREAVAFHVRVLSQAYDKVVASRDSAVSQGKLSAEPFSLEQNPDDIGTMFIGELQSKLEGTQIVLPMRDKTIVITIESDEYLEDIENYILPNFTFIP